jgi:hypothetical protein
MIQVIADKRQLFRRKELKEKLLIEISVGEPTVALGQQN